jgi:chemotaxis protein CheD
MRDPVLRIGGMNHFMLPDGDDQRRHPARYGSYAMELLINELLKAGARASASRPRCSAAATC